MLTGHIASGRLRNDGGGTASFSVLAVLLLVLAAYSIAIMEVRPGGRDTECWPSLVEAEVELRSFLIEALDTAFERAIPIAATQKGIGLGDAMDVNIVDLVRSNLPSTAGGWDVVPVDVRGGYGGRGLLAQTGGVPSAGEVPFANLVVDLTCPGIGLPIRLTFIEEGAGPTAGDVVTGAAGLVEGLAGPWGPVALGARNLLWQEAQSRAFSGARDLDELLSHDDVVRAVNATVLALVMGGTPPPPGPPSLDLSHLVRQSVEGAVERNLGWIDDYLLGVDGFPGLDTELGSLLPQVLSRVVLDMLEGSSGGTLPVIEGEDLEHALTNALEALDGLERGLAIDGGGNVFERVLALVEEVVLGSSSTVKRLLSIAVADVARSVGGLGLACARDAILSVGMMGRQVDGSDGTPWTGTGGLRVRPEKLSVTTSWSGKKASEPPGLLDGEGLKGVGAGTLPYTSVCSVSVNGSAVLVVSLVGASGRPLQASFSVPVDLVWEVAIVTGRPLEGVHYTASATLLGDLARVADAIWTRASASVGWLTARFRDAAELVGTWASSLYEDMRTSVMTKSAYTLSQALWRIGGSLMDNETGRAINSTWDLLMGLFGDDLRQALTWELDVMGLDLVLSIDPARQQLDVGLIEGCVRLNVSLRRLCDPHPPFEARPVEGYHWGVFGQARLDHGERRAVVHLDPLTLERASVLTMEISWGDASEGGQLVVEGLEARKLGRGWSVSLSDLTGAGWLLSAAGGGAADAGLVVHGDLAEEGAARKALERAVKDAWMATMKGWKVGDLVGRTGRGPDANTFLETLMRELHDALVERGTKLVSEVEVYVDVSFPSPGLPDVRLSLVLSEPLEVLLPLAAWAKRSLGPLVGRAITGSIEGASDALASWLAEHVRVRFELSWAVKAPDWLASRAPGGLPDELGLVVRGQVNAAALAAVVGRGKGRWEASVDVMLRGVPGIALAIVPGMGSTKWRWAEVTLLRATLREAAMERVLISQVLYDARGRDVDLEFVELWNSGERMLDMKGFVLQDDKGSFSLGGHLPLLPGDHMLVARNTSAVRGEWGVQPDVGRMGLRLANDGDEVRLLDPDGRMLDNVAWEGHLAGWEDLVAEEGLALVRVEGDQRPCESSAWCVGPPSPRRAGW